MQSYVRNIAGIIAKAQITNGGPVILYQPENEYTSVLNAFFLEAKYMQYVEDQARAAGIVVPFMSNDAYAAGNNAPGTGKGEVDIYVRPAPLQRSPSGHLLTVPRDMMGIRSDSTALVQKAVLPSGRPHC